MRQRTLEKEVEIKGIGLHSGCLTKMLFKSAPQNSGIVFIRSDLPAAENRFPALYSGVADTRNCTCLANEYHHTVSTVEHIMAALYALGIDNALIETDGQELPIMDGSAHIIYEILKKCSSVEQEAPRRFLKVRRTVEFEDDKGAYIKLVPADKLKIKFTIDFPSRIVGHQEFNATINEDLFAQEIAPARTFCEKYQVEYLQSIGLIKGGSLENAVVLDGDTILNEGGFRVMDECVKHKVLDCIGDMYTSGYRLLAGIEAWHTGHFHNNEVLKKLFADTNNYEVIEG